MPTVYDKIMLLILTDVTEPNVENKYAQYYYYANVKSQYRPPVGYKQSNVKITLKGR